MTRQKRCTSSPDRDSSSAGCIGPPPTRRLTSVSSSATRLVTSPSARIEASGPSRKRPLPSAWPRCVSITRVPVTPPISHPASIRWVRGSRDVMAAVSELRRRTGVQRVCLLGFRLGALLGALAAPDCEGVCGLMAIAPVVNGRRYLRELRTTRLAAMLGSAARPDARAVVGTWRDRRKLPRSQRLPAGARHALRSR